MKLSEIALKFFGIPYVWGGNTPEQGLDCSGLVCECLRSLGHIGKSDYTAQMIYDKFSNKRGFTIVPDALLFFGRTSDSITHVAIALNDTLMIEAGGEGSKPTDKGYVRIRPISNRTDLIRVVHVE